MRLRCADACALDCSAVEWVNLQQEESQRKQQMCNSSFTQTETIGHRLVSPRQLSLMPILRLVRFLMLQGAIQGVRGGPNQMPNNDNANDAVDSNMCLL